MRDIKTKTPALGNVQSRQTLTAEDAITWEAPEYIYKEKGVDWFWAVGIIVVSLAIASFVYNNVLFAILIIIGGFTLIMYAVKKPQQVRFTINERGVGINTTLYPYSALESFGIEEYGTEPKILIKSKKALMPYIALPMRKEDGEAIRNYLSKYLKEAEHTEPLPQKIMEYLGF